MQNNEQSIDEFIANNWKKLLKGLRKNKREEIGLSLHLLKENCQRMQIKQKEYITYVDLLSNCDLEKDDTQLLQLQLIDKIEAFHQHVYVTLASLVRVINYLKLQGDNSQIPINSIKQFLTHVKEGKFRYKVKLHRVIEKLIYSEDYRAKFVDHPQQHKMHNWMSYTYQANGSREAVIIYYILYGSQPVYVPNSVYDPHDPDFKPPLPTGTDFYISPDINDTLDATNKLIIEFLS